MSSSSSFESRKHQVVSSLVETLDAERRDKSPKGFIDAPILNLIHIINRHRDYYTTSSCSGRIAIYCEGLEEQENLEKTTKGGKWLYVSHDPVDIPSDAGDDWIKRLLFGSEYHRLGEPAPSDAEDIRKQQLVFFKFEPLVSPLNNTTRDRLLDNIFRFARIFLDSARRGIILGSVHASQRSGVPSRISK